MPKEWFIPPRRADRAEAALRLGVSPILAQLLHNRGLIETDACKRFLEPKVADLFPPERLFGAVEAAERIVSAIREQRRIVLYGDYDVDGITGVSILWHCIRMAGGDADFYVPHRLEEGYGLNVEALTSIAEGGAGLVVTVDCGITALEPAAHARRLGLELIITDHHAPLMDDAGRPQLPEGTLVVHPGLGAEPPVNRDLSGAGVAFKLAWAIAQRVSGGVRARPEFRDFLVSATGLAGLGLIADVVPLTGENRILAYHGLRGLPSNKWPGVAALIEAAGLGGERLTGYDIGFKIAPRLNAIGRMGHARLAVELLTRADASESVRIARNLEQQNTKRRTLERRIAMQAREMVRETRQDGADGRAIVLASSDWHAGVIGIVASRLVDEFHRPTVMIALENGTGQGSARSVPGFALNEALASCREHLRSFGGHAMAAGLRIDAGAVGAFSEAFRQCAAQRLGTTDVRPRLRIDDEAALNELDDRLLDDLARMEPFGCENPSPRLATDWLRVVGEPRAVGAGGDHLQIVFEQEGLQRKGIAFGLAKHRAALCDHRRCRVAFQPIRNEFNGRRSVEMQIVDFQFPGGVGAAAPTA